jgi:hypothetical protein
MSKQTKQRYEGESFPLKNKRNKHNFSLNISKVQIAPNRYSIRWESQLELICALCTDIEFYEEWKSKYNENC